MSNLKDVAKKANVSITTVSRVINGSDKVNSKTSERVKKVMIMLGYQPNRVAQRLRTVNGRSKLLGLIIPDIKNQFYSNIVRGIEDVAYGKDYAVILCNSDENPSKERFYLEVLKSESVDGIILPPVLQFGDEIDNIINNGIPIVCFDRKLGNKKVDTVVIDNELGAFIATSHLIELGHKQIAILTSSLVFSSFSERQRGYERALKENGIEIDKRFILEGDPRSSDNAKVLTTKLINLDSPPTAIFATNNLMTLGAIEAINEQNLKIPEEISLIGFDDVAWAKAITPPLTVVRQPAYEMGKKAAELFFKKVEDKTSEPVEIVMVPSLVVRQSTGAPKKK